MHIIGLYLCLICLNVSHWHWPMSMSLSSLLFDSCVSPFHMFCTHTQISHSSVKILNLWRSFPPSRPDIFAVFAFKASLSHALLVRCCEIRCVGHGWLLLVRYCFSEATGMLAKLGPVPVPIQLWLSWAQCPQAACIARGGGSGGAPRSQHHPVLFILVLTWAALSNLLTTTQCFHWLYWL